MQKFSQHPNYFKHIGGIIISTFAGQESLFGFDSLNDAWSHLKHTIEHSTSFPVSLIK